MARGLTHPTAHVGNLIKDKKTGDEYVYEGYEFYDNILSKVGKYEILRSLKKPMSSGALFKFTRNSKKYGIIYYTRSISQNSSINAGTLEMEYSGRKGATENLGIQADKLIRGGKVEKRILNGLEIPCVIFRSKKELVNSILTALKNNKNVGPHIYDVLAEYFDSDLKKINWNDSFRQSDINEIGKYIGELIIGVVVLDNKSSGIIGSTLFQTKKIKEFIVPDDPSFSGVDSAFVCHDGEIIPISSKLGAGAKASIFTNLLPKVMARGKVQKSVIGDIAAAANRAGITIDILNAKRGSKEVLYEYGMRKILNISPGDIKKPIEVYNDARVNKITDKVQKTILAIHANKDIEKKVKDQLPKSITSAFSREVSRRLNNDKVSLEIVEEVLAGKNFYQANLVLSKFLKGEIFFKFLPSGKAKVSFTGSKAAINDLTASQGMLNYELKYQ